MNRPFRWKRLVVWAVELIAQSYLLIVPLFLILRPPGNTTMRDIVDLGLIILGYFGLTGYALTTAISRLYWNKHSIWSYPIFDALLFFAHFEILSHLFKSGALAGHYHLLLVACGMGVAFVTSLLGSYVLKRWDEPILG